MYIWYMVKSQTGEFREIQQPTCERALSPKLLKLSILFNCGVVRTALCQDIGFVFKGDCKRTHWIVLGFAVESRSKNLVPTPEQTNYTREIWVGACFFHKGVKTNLAIVIFSTFQNGASLGEGLYLNDEKDYAG